MVTIVEQDSQKAEQTYVENSSEIKQCASSAIPRKACKNVLRIAAKN